MQLKIPKINFLHSHFHFYSTNLGNVSDEQRGCFYQYSKLGSDTRIRKAHHVDQLLLGTARDSHEVK
jgi:hypothetical protein